MNQQDFELNDKSSKKLTRTVSHLSKRGQRDPDYLAVEVIDTLNDRIVQHVRGDGKHEEKLQQFVNQYGSRGDEYVVQIRDTKTDEVIKDNQGHGGEIREFEGSASRKIQDVLNMIPRGKWTVQTGHWLLHQEVDPEYKDDEFLPSWKPPRKYESRLNRKARLSIADRIREKQLPQGYELQEKDIGEYTVCF